jgi:hypothetical protein
MITTASKRDLYDALSEVNKIYDDNIVFKRIEQIPVTRMRFTLKVLDSRKAGSRLGYTGRRLVNACYHVHGDFFDVLFKINPSAVVISRGDRITVNKGNWIDKNIGSMMYPLYHSEACLCRYTSVEEKKDYKEYLKNRFK